MICFSPIIIVVCSNPRMTNHIIDLSFSITSFGIQFTRLLNHINIIRVLLSINTPNRQSVFCSSRIVLYCIWTALNTPISVYTQECADSSWISLDNIATCHSASGISSQNDMIFFCSIVLNKVINQGNVVLCIVVAFFIQFCRIAHAIYKVAIIAVRHVNNNSINTFVIPIDYRAIKKCSSIGIRCNNLSILHNIPHCGTVSR